MKRVKTKAALLKKRVRTVQNRAKFAGVLYLLGAIALAGLAALFPMLETSSVTLKAMEFYKPLVELLKNGTEALKSLTLDQVVVVLVAVLYALLLLVLAINVLTGLSKLGWLFKRRASYTNGFNRNMYAMDSLAKKFSSSFSAIIVINLIIYLLTGTAEITKFAYLALAGGFGIHLFVGLVGGTVTVFTLGDYVEEEERQSGLFLYFIRNVVQIAATAAIIYFLAPESVLFVKVKELVDAVVIQKVAFSALNIKEFIPAGLELFVWLFVLVLVKHSTAATEFNRDGMDGAGMKNFRVFAFFTVLAVGALTVLPYLNIVPAMETVINKNLIIVAAVAFVAFVLDCVLKPGHHEISSDEMDAETYFNENYDVRYNNTIV